MPSNNAKCNQVWILETLRRLGLDIDIDMIVSLDISKSELYCKSSILKKKYV